MIREGVKLVIWMLGGDIEWKRTRHSCGGVSITEPREVEPHPPNGCGNICDSPGNDKGNNVGRTARTSLFGDFKSRADDSLIRHKGDLMEKVLPRSESPEPVSATSAPNRSIPCRNPKRPHVRCGVRGHVGARRTLQRARSLVRSARQGNASDSLKTAIPTLIVSQMYLLLKDHREWKNDKTDDKWMATI